MTKARHVTEEFLYGGPERSLCESVEVKMHFIGSSKMLETPEILDIYQGERKEVGPAKIKTHKKLDRRSHLSLLSQDIEL